MDLNRLSTKQQWAILITLVVLLATPYALKRFLPAYQTLVENNERLAKNQDTIKNPNYPESPAEDEDDVRANLEELQQSFDVLSNQTDALLRRIAPIDSQDVVLEISAAAKVNNITIIENVPYIVQRVGASASTNAPVVSTRTERPDRDDRRAQRAANRGSAQPMSGKGITGAPPREGELIYDIVNKLDHARPLQMLELQGTYFGLMAFIESVKNLPVQVTLLNVNIDTQVQVTSQNTQGLPQLIRVSLIVAL
ncbi:MAG: hypothetical protein Q8M99_01895 [Methylotenera sp.]|nr:hypothetical protein [Methylotenera sp.]